MPITFPSGRHNFLRMRKELPNQGKQSEEQCRDHKLVGDYAGIREYPIEQPLTGC